MSFILVYKDLLMPLAFTFLFLYFTSDRIKDVFHNKIDKWYDLPRVIFYFGLTLMNIVVLYGNIMDFYYNFLVN